MNIWPWSRIRELESALERADETVRRLYEIVQELDPSYFTRKRTPKCPS